MKTNIVRVRDGEHVIHELENLLSREQINLVADAKGYTAGRAIAKITGGTDVGKWGKWDPAGANGLSVCRGVLMDHRAGSTGTIRGVAHVRLARLNGKKIDWGMTTPPTAVQITAAIASLRSLDVTNGYGMVEIGY